MHVKNKNKKNFQATKVGKEQRKLCSGGTHLFFKRAKNYLLPEMWPTYYSKAKGCNIWDINKNKYADLSFMGLGTNTLGYANKIIDNFVINKLKDSNMSTLNSIEDIELAEKLIDIHNWADMVSLRDQEVKPMQ